MNRPRKFLLPAIVGLSLVLNIAFLADYGRRGILRRLLVRMDMAEAPVEKSAYQASMENRYRKLPGLPGAAVFAGDSLIFQGPWPEFYPDVRNRGIPNETSAQLLGRLGEVVRDRPRRLILLTGANDLIQAVPLTQLVRNVRSILEKVATESPKTKVALLGMLPVNPTIPGGPRYDNDLVAEANRLLRVLTIEFADVEFLDLTRLLADESGKLRPEFTEDGLHLTIDGYLAVREAIGALLSGMGSSEHSSPGGTAETPK